MGCRLLLPRNPNPKFTIPMKKGLLILFSLASAIASKAQIGIGTAAPNPAAQLEISSTNKGVLFPRLTTAQRDAIVAPPAGLVIYNKSINKFQGTVATELESSFVPLGGAMPVQPEEVMPGMPGMPPIPAYAAAQSFKAAANTIMGGIAVNVVWVITPGTFTVKVFSGDGVTGTLLTSQDVTVTGQGETIFQLNAPVNLLANEYYTFQLAPKTGKIFLSDGAAYANGAFYQNNTFTAADLAFKILSAGSWINLNL